MVINLDVQCGIEMLSCPFYGIAQRLERHVSSVPELLAAAMPAYIIAQLHYYGVLVSCGATSSPTRNPRKVYGGCSGSDTSACPVRRLRAPWVSWR